MLPSFKQIMDTISSPLFTSNVALRTLERYIKISASNIIELMQSKLYETSYQVMRK